MHLDCSCCLHQRSFLTSSSFITIIACVDPPPDTPDARCALVSSQVTITAATLDGDIKDEELREAALSALRTAFTKNRLAPYIVWLIFKLLFFLLLCLALLFSTNCVKPYWRLNWAASKSWIIFSFFPYWYPARASCPTGFTRYSCACEKYHWFSNFPASFFLFQNVGVVCAMSKHMCRSPLQV